MLNEKSQAKTRAGKDAETPGPYALLAGVENGIELWEAILNYLDV